MLRALREKSGQFIRTDDYYIKQNEGNALEKKIKKELLKYNVTFWNEKKRISKPAYMLPGTANWNEIPKKKKRKKTTVVLCNYKKINDQIMGYQSRKEKRKKIIKGRRNSWSTDDGWEFSKVNDKYQPLDPGSSEDIK